MFKPLVSNYESREEAEEQKVWLEGVRDGMRAASGGFTSFNSSTSRWGSAEEFVLALRAVGKEVRVIFLEKPGSKKKKTREPMVFNIRFTEGGSDAQSTWTVLKEGDSESWPDPRQTPVIVYNGSDHFNGVVPDTWQKPRGEASLGVGTHGTLERWLAAHGSVLWVSAGKGFCLYESAAMSLLQAGFFE